MKYSTTTPNRTYSIVIAFLVIFSACQKERIQKQTDSLTRNSNIEVSPSKEGGGKTLTLRPGPDNGQDVYVDKEIGVKSSNLNYVPELNANAWTIDGNLYGSGSYIRFDSLVKIPASAQVVSAKLYLYGLSSSLSTPQGNNGDNACYVQRVLGWWEESTLRYKDQPGSTTENQATLAASTSQWNYNAVVDVTAIVSYFVAHPNENYGFFIHQQIQTPYRSIVFGSSEQTDKSLRPKLVVVYENIDNPLAGPYLWDFTRWPCQDPTSCAPDISFTGEQTTFTPDDATTIEVPSGYFIQPRYVLSFVNNGGVLSNFQLSMNADDVAVMAANGVNMIDGPNILIADPISKTFEFQYLVKNVTPAYRYIVDKYYKP